jgi:hypothetical protein
MAMTSLATSPATNTVSEWEEGRRLYEIYRAHEAEGDRFVRPRYLKPWDALGYESRVAWVRHGVRRRQHAGFAVVG